MLGGLAASAPCAALLASPIDARVMSLLLLGSTTLAVAALRQGRGRSSWPWVVAAALAGGVALGPSLADRPGWTFALLLGVLALFYRRRPVRRGGLDAADPHTLPAWGALGPAAAVVLLVSLHGEPPALVAVSSIAACALAALLGLQALFRLGLPPPEHRRWLTLWILLFFGGAVSGDAGLRSLLWALSATPPLIADMIRSPEARPFASLFDTILSRPELMLASSFGLVIAFGALLLALPIARAGAGSVAGIDAVFTAVSATCVTGLIVLDTPSVFSLFGEGVLLLLIQLGGLGIMSFSTAALLALNQRPSLRHERALAEVFVSWEGHDPARAVKHIFAVTFVAEALGALLLAARFATYYGEAPGPALWRGLFTAVSAFCNAGFALQTTSLMPYQTDAFVILVVATLIFVGSLGPVAVVARFRAPQRVRRVSVHLMEAAAVVLTVAGAVAFLAFEWSGVLADLSFFDRLHNALFQSVTLRTAGFNSVDIAAVRPHTEVFMLIWMFIGGSPGSTAGGIKTTTFAIILLSVASVLSGRPEAVYRNRRLSHDTFYRATAIFVLGLASVLVLWWALLLTQPLEPMSALFEAVSALATVGLSLGATNELDEVGKLLVSIGMFAGRLGPVTVLFLFAAERRTPHRRFPETSLPVG